MWRAGRCYERENPRLMMLYEPVLSKGHCFVLTALLLLEAVGNALVVLESCVAEALPSFLA